MKRILILAALFFSFNVAAFAQTASDFELRGIRLFNDGNICALSASGEEQSLSLSNIQIVTETVQSSLGEGGSFCSTPPFFVGGKKLETVDGIITQAQPVVQAYGRGLLISEKAGETGTSEGGSPTAFSNLTSQLITPGATNMVILEIQLPTGCDFIDDDNDAVGTSSNLDQANDFSLFTCTSTAGVSVNCNAVDSDLLQGEIIEVATDSEPAKMRLTYDHESTDVQRVDSILVRFDSQDIFCESGLTGDLEVTVLAKNPNEELSNLTQTLGTASLGAFSETATLSIEDVSVDSEEIISNPIKITESDEESFPLGGQATNTLLDPTLSLASEEVTSFDIWLSPNTTNLFSEAPTSDNILVSDDSLTVGTPRLVTSVADDQNAPVGTLIIPISAGSSIDPQSVKTEITINNLKLNDVTDSKVSLAFYESSAGAIVNIPAVASFQETGFAENPINYSAFNLFSLRATKQTANASSSTVFATTRPAQFTTDEHLALLTSRNAELGGIQIENLVEATASSGSSSEEPLSTISEVLSFIDDNGGLDAVIIAGGETLDTVIAGIRTALGLS